MRTLGDQEWCVVHGYVIEMYSKSRHSFDDFERRFDVDEALLSRKWTETLNPHPVLDANCPVLMPAQRPILVHGFVEQDGTYGPSSEGSAFCQHSSKSTFWIQKAV